MIILAAVLLFFLVWLVGWMDGMRGRGKRISSRLFSGSAERNYDDRLCDGGASYRQISTTHILFLFFLLFFCAPKGRQL